MIRCVDVKKNKIKDLFALPKSQRLNRVGLLKKHGANKGKCVRKSQTEVIWSTLVSPRTSISHVHQILCNLFIFFTCSFKGSEEDVHMDLFLDYF